MGNVRQKYTELFRDFENFFFQNSYIFTFEQNYLFLRTQALYENEMSVFLIVLWISDGGLGMKMKRKPECVENQIHFITAFTQFATQKTVATIVVVHLAIVDLGLSTVNVKHAKITGIFRNNFFPNQLIQLVLSFGTLWMPLMA
jgi:hypothetical protein